jgi:hypothetical protein
MSTWTASTVIAAAPAEVIDLLTDPAAASKWSPVPFEVESLVGARLSADERARLTGCLAGLRVAFDLEVHAADGERLSLSARGPIGLDVLYELRAEGDGARVHACVTVHPGRGITGAGARPRYRRAARRRRPARRRHPDRRSGRARRG